MIYNYCSSAEVIADLISRTRMTDATFADDILEWLKSGLNMMRVRNMLQPDNRVLEIHDHVTKLPCGLVNIDGIFYNGQRLRLGTGVIDTRVSPFIKLKGDFDSYFTSDTTSDGYTDNAQNYLLLRGDDLKLNTSLLCENDYYIPYPNHIQTSFEEGCIQLFFRKMPTDKDGYPLIPDEENTKFALFWWLMGNLALAGYKHNDPKMDWDYCEAKFTHYAREGKGIIKYWSTDKKEAVKNLTCNLIPPSGYYNTFFVGGEQPKYVN